MFGHHYAMLALYHTFVLDEMERRGYKPDGRWRDSAYRGKNATAFKNPQKVLCVATPAIYPEHDLEYLNECIANLAAKGVRIDREKALGF